MTWVAEVDPERLEPELDIFPGAGAGSLD